MSYRPTRAQRFGPPLRACAWAYAYCSVAALFVGFVFYGYVAPQGSLARLYVVESAREWPATWFAAIVLVSGIAAVLQSHMRGIILHPDGIETLDYVSFGLPRVRRLDWPMIDRIRFDAKASIGIDLWNGTFESLPEVSERHELERALGYIAMARAIPFTGDPGVDPSDIES